MKIRTADRKDLDAIFEIEQNAFIPEVASDKKSLKRSIESSHQKVFVIEENEVRGCVILYIYKKSVRIFSIAVLKPFQNQGYGRVLLEHCEKYAHKNGKEILSLEADAHNIQLINWYTNNGFHINSYIENYYGKGSPAYLMTKKLINQRNEKDRLKNIIVTDSPWTLNRVGKLEIVNAKEYITSEKFQNEKQIRVFNFCSDYAYQSVGYYISLLAEARGQRVFPSVSTMQDILSKSIVKIFGEELKDVYFNEFENPEGNKATYQVILGCEATGKSSRLSKSLYKLFDAPFVEYTFVKSETWLLEKVRLMTLDEILDNTKIPIDGIIAYSLAKKNYGKRRVTNYPFSLAILVNDNEEHPPSDKTALEKFRAAGVANGFYVEFITKEDANRINEFDALFIRETTAVNDHTYQIARHAQAEGLVVVDDPWSILKCSNKFFLYERMRKSKVKMPSTKIISSTELNVCGFEHDLRYPVIVKQPDSAFSLGVFKANDKADFIRICSQILQKSEFAIVQEYIESDYDWRIGIMNNEVLFACKYYMAKDHWQIYNWNGEGDAIEGRSETLNISDVPKKILETALKATSVIGDSLYGVDLKLVNGKCYLIEVNDNPNIDSGIEDAVLKDVLYDRIIRNIRTKVVEQQKKTGKICI